MTKTELLKKLERIEREVAEVRTYLSQEPQAAPPTDEAGQTFAVGYTLDELYAAFGKRKQPYARRLQKALERTGIHTLADFLRLTPGQLFDLPDVSTGTLLQTRKALGKLGIAW